MCEMQQRTVTVKLFLSYSYFCRRFLNLPPVVITGERNFPKRKFFTTDYHSSTSRKMNKHCYQCGKRGHVKANCRSKRPKTSGENNPTPSSQVLPSTSQGNDEACGFCAKRGHNVLNCFLEAAIGKCRSINFCSTGKSAGATEIVVNGHQFWALIVTGAGLSLMLEKLLHLF